MAASRHAVTNYMMQLMQSWRTLEQEKQRLLNPQARLAEIADEQAELVEAAQEALARYNAAHGTSFTLAQVRNRLNPTNLPTP